MPNHFPYSAVVFIFSWSKLQSSSVWWNSLPQLHTWHQILVSLKSKVQSLARYLPSLKGPECFHHLLYVQHWSLKFSQQGAHSHLLPLEVLKLCFILWLAQACKKEKKKKKKTHISLAQHYDGSPSRHVWRQMESESVSGLSEMSFTSAAHKESGHSRSGGLHGGKEGVSKNLSSTLTSLTQR